MARSAYVVPSRRGGSSGMIPASRTILLISKGCTTPTERSGAAVDAGSARPGVTPNRKQHRNIAAAQGTPAIAASAFLAQPGQNTVRWHGVKTWCRNQSASLQVDRRFLVV